MTRRQRLVGWLVHIVVALVATWPLVLHLADRIPLGRETVRTVPYFNLWSLEWTAQRLPHLLQGWWDAPIFFPHHGTYAFSELQPLTGAVFAVLEPLTGRAAAYDLILLGALVLNGVTGAALARRLGCDPAPAILTGVLAQVVPFALAELGVLQLVMLWPVLAAMAALLAWVETPSVRHAVLLGLAVAAAFATCGYHGLLFCLVGGAAGLLLVRRTWSWPDGAGSLAIAAGVAIALTAPFLLGQQARLRDHRWAESTILVGSASWSDLWPGLMLAVLGVGGLVVARRRPEARYLGAVAVLASLVALGLHLRVGGWQPWATLVDHVGALARLRSPFRATALLQLALVGLAAMALQRLWRVHRALPVAAVVLVVLSADLGAGRLVELPRADAATVWLAEHDDGEPVVLLPFAPGSAAGDFEPTTVAMLHGLDDSHPLVNGYSGFFSHDHDEIGADLAGFPDERSLDRLNRLGVRYAVVDPHVYVGTRAFTDADHGLERLAEDDDAILYRLIG